MRVTQRIPGLLIVWLGLLASQLALADTTQTSLKLFNAQSGVNDLAQTPDGFLWVATPDGLKRFDGQRFISVDHLNFEIDDLLTTRSGRLIIAGAGRPGLYALQPGTRSVLPHESGIGGPVWAVDEAQAGGLWVATPDGLLFWDGQKKTAISYQKPWPRVRAVVADKGNKAWLATEGGVIRVESGSAKIVWSGDNVNSLRVQADGTVLLATEHQGVAIYREGASQVEVVNGWRGDPSVLSMSSGPGAQYMFGTGSGLLQGTLSKHQPVVTPSELPNSRVTASLWGRSGTRWLGTDTGTIGLVAPSGPFTTLTELNGRNVAFALTHAADTDTLWLQESTSVVHLAGETITRHTPPAALKLYSMRPLAMDVSGNLWTADQGRGLVKLRDGTFTLYGRADGLPSLDIHCLHFSKATGKLWMGFVSGGLAVYDGKGFVSISPQDLGCEGRVRGIAESSDHALWVASEGGHLCRMPPNGNGPGVRAAEASHVSFTGLAVDVRDTLWIGTENNGLGRFADGNLVLIDKTRGLRTNHVGNVFVTRDGALWLISRQGAFRAQLDVLNDLVEGKDRSAAVVQFGTLDGLPSTTLIWGWNPPAVQDKQGRIWLSTLAGLARFDPDADIHTKAVTVVIDEVLVNGTVVNASAASVPAGRGIVEFRFAAAVEAGIHHLRWRYRLDGLDDAWNETSDRQSANYANLHPGRYVFHAAAIFQGERRPTAEATFTLILVPPFYRTWWFLAAAASLVFAATLLAIKLRVHQREAAQEVLWQERQRIARDLHDTLEQSMLAVRFQIQAAVRQPTSADSVLARASQMLEQGLAEARGLIWALRSEQQNRDLQGRIGVVVAELLKGRDIAFDQKAAGEPFDLDGATVLAIERILAAATANTVKHGNATKVSVNLRYAEDLVVTYKDNGQGFDLASRDLQTAEHMGLRGIRERAEAIGAGLSIDSKPMQGVSIEVRVQQPRRKR